MHGGDHQAEQDAEQRLAGEPPQDRRHLVVELVPELVGEAWPLALAALVSRSRSTSSGVMCTPIGSPSTCGNCQLPIVVSALMPGLLNERALHPQVQSGRGRVIREQLQHGRRARRSAAPMRSSQRPMKPGRAARDRRTARRA